MEPKYGILEGHFYIEGSNIMAYVKYRDRKTGEVISRTVNTAEVRKDLNMDINNFIAGVVEEIEEIGGD